MEVTIVRHANSETCSNNIILACSHKLNSLRLSNSSCEQLDMPLTSVYLHIIKVARVRIILQVHISKCQAQVVPRCCFKDPLTVQHLRVAPRVSRASKTDLLIRVIASHLQAY